MATPTPNIQLHRSEVEDLVSLSQDFNTNWDLIDAYIGAAKGSVASIAARLVICLANSGGIQSGETFPETPTLGQLFYKSDTEILYIRSADSWDQIGISDHGALAGLGDDDHSQYLNNARHDVVARHTLGSVVPHDALASLTEKAHGSLSGVTANLHHAQSHTLASHSTKAHTELTGITASQHHTKKAFGTWAGRTLGTTYLSATDGFVVAYINADGQLDQGNIAAYSDINNPPTTLRAKQSVHLDIDSNTKLYWGSLMIPVKSGDRYRVILTQGYGSCVATMYWIPLS